jgi:hypothetical protein
VYRERAREQGCAMAQRVWRGFKSRKIVRVLLRVREIVRAAIRGRELEPVQTAMAVRGGWGGVRNFVCMFGVWECGRG